MTSIVDLTSARKVFRAGEMETHAVDGVDLKVVPGDYVAIMGRSGSGKSTLLSLLGLIEPLDQGTYKLAGVETSTMSESQRSRLRLEHIGFVFQFFHLIPDLTVEDNVRLPMMYAGRPDAEVEQRSSELIERLGLRARRRHFPAQLSGGQQQRTAIARALSNDPDLLLVDEPTGNLDSESGEAVMQLLDELSAEGRTICLVTHDVGCAKRAKRMLRMQDGQLFAC